MPKGMQSQKRPGPSDKGMKIIKNWEEMYDRTTAPAELIARGNADNVLAAQGQGKNAESRRFGAHYMKRDEGDHRLELANMMATPARPLPYTMDEIAALERKLQQGAEMGYDGWFANTWSFESDNPVMQKWARDINPEYFRRREEQIDNIAELQKQIAKMKLYGPRSEQDLMLLYNIDTGAINTDTLNGPLWDPQGQTGAYNHYRRGLFSPIQKAKIGFDKQRLDRPWNPTVLDRPGMFRNGPNGDRRNPDAGPTNQGADVQRAGAFNITLPQGGALTANRLGPNDGYY